MTPLPERIQIEEVIELVLRASQPLPLPAAVARKIEDWWSHGRLRVWCNGRLTLPHERLRYCVVIEAEPDGREWVCDIQRLGIRLIGQQPCWEFSHADAAALAQSEPLVSEPSAPEGIPPGLSAGGVQEPVPAPVEENDDADAADDDDDNGGGITRMDLDIAQAIGDRWPQGIPASFKGKERDREIIKKLGKPTSPRSIQRALKKLRDPATRAMIQHALEERARTSDK